MGNTASSYFNPHSNQLEGNCRQLAEKTNKEFRNNCNNSGECSHNYLKYSAADKKLECADCSPTKLITEEEFPNMYRRELSFIQMLGKDLPTPDESANRGVTIAFLVAFCTALNLWDVPTSQVRRDFIIPMTSKQRCRFVELPVIVEAGVVGPYTNPSNTLVVGQGYTARLNSLPTLNSFGTPNNGPLSIPVTHSAGSNDPKGWNLVGNPYPSPISWTALRALNSDLFASDDACYLWKASGKGIDGIWSTYDGNVGANVNGSGDVINSSLGFFVYVDKSGTLKFDNSVRTYNYLSPEIFGTKSATTNTLSLSIKDEVAGTIDEAVAYTSYKAGYARKIAQPEGATNATIAFEVEGKKAAINKLTAIDSKTELPISISTPKAGSYTLSLNNKNINLPVYLKDAVTGTYTDLSAATTITTTAKETVGRYSLVFSKPEQFTISSKQLTVYPNPANSSVVINGSHIVSVQLVDNLGRVVKVVALKDATNPALSLGGLGAGSYHLRVKTTDGKVSTVALVKE